MQSKLDSQLWYALQASRGQAMAGLDAVYESAAAAANADANGPIRFATVTRSNETVMTSVAAGINPTDHIQLDFIPSPYASKPGSFDEHTKDKAEFGSA